MKKSLKKEIAKRAMDALECKRMNDLACLFSTSPQNLNGYLDRETFIDLIKPELYKRHINVDWIKTGQGNMKVDDEKNPSITKQHAPYNNHTPSHQPPKISDLLQKTAAVLESPTIFSSALKSNIEAFHEAVNVREELQSARILLGQHENKIKEQEVRLKSVEERLQSAEEKKLSG